MSAADSPFRGLTAAHLPLHMKAGCLLGSPLLHLTAAAASASSATDKLPSLCCASSRSTGTSTFGTSTNKATVEQGAARWRLQSLLIEMICPADVHACLAALLVGLQVCGSLVALESSRHGRACTQSSQADCSAAAH